MTHPDGSKTWSIDEVKNKFDPTGPDKIEKLAANYMGLYRFCDPLGDHVQPRNQDSYLHRGTMFMSVFHKVIAIPLLLSLSACGLTPKQWAYVGAGVIVTGYVASHQDGNHRSAAQQVTIQPVNCQATSCQ